MAILLHIYYDTCKEHTHTWLLLSSTSLKITTRRLWNIFFSLFASLKANFWTINSQKDLNIESLFCRTASKLPETLVGYQKKVSLKRWKIENMILIQLFKPEVAEIARSFASFRVEPELSICVILTKCVVILYSFDTFSGKQFGFDFYSFKYLSIEKK